MKAPKLKKQLRAAPGKSAVPHNFETFEWAEGRRELLLGRLRRAGHDEAWKKLSACTIEEPCLSEACARCLRNFRLNFAKAARELGLGKGVWTRVSIIPDVPLYSPGDLSTFNIAGLIERTQRGLKRHLPDTVFIGGVDLSFNLWENVGEGCQGHLYMAGNALDSPDFRTEVRLAVPPSLTTRRPYIFDPVDDFERVLTYSYKNGFYRRSSYADPRLRVNGTPRINGQPQGLKVADDLEIAEWLLDMRVGSRLILSNIRRIVPNSKSGNFRLRRAAPLVLKGTE